MSGACFRFSLHIPLSIIGFGVYNNVSGRCTTTVFQHWDVHMFLCIKSTRFNNYCIYNRYCNYSLVTWGTSIGVSTVPVVKASAS